MRHQNRRVTRATGSFDEKILAAIAGGFYSFSNDGFLRSPIQGSIPNPDTEFLHVMPHGTIAVVKDGDNLLSVLNVLYPSDGEADEFHLPNGGGTLKSRNDVFLRLYDLESAIHFPWENAGGLPIYEQQINVASVAVRRTKRLHFIGLSGHKLLRHSLRKLFWDVGDEEAFAAIEWHVATKDPDSRRVFDSLLDCILPETFLEKDDLRDKLHKRMTPYTDFAHWLRVSPHLRRPARRTTP